MTSAGLKMFSIGIFAWCAHPILMRAFFAMHTSLLPILLGTATSAIFAALCWGLANTSLGFLGLPLATSVSAIVLFLLLMVGLRSKLSRVDGRRVLRLLIISGLAAVATAAVVLVVSRYANIAQTHLASLAKVLVLGIGGVWLYLAIGKALGLEEAGYAMTIITRKRRAS
jgi:peptidoglycan biosynthesis protein MviN/MurJ (putative lipid II flippase)